MRPRPHQLQRSHLHFTPLPILSHFHRASSGSDEDEEAARIAALRAELAALSPPRPLDLFIQAETTVVVITGPNTGEGLLV
jgi:dsDNA-specific endonuclease/ATPase MutS2